MKPHKWQKEIIAWSNGEQIQGRYRSDDWVDLPNPSWCLDHEYRIKPEEFKWQKEKDHWENGGTIQYKSLKSGEWITYDEAILNPPIWDWHEWRIKPTETLDEETRKSIDEVLDCMDFEKIKKVMDFLNWTWWNTDGVPEIYELRIFAREQLTRVAKEIMNSDKNNYAISCGGFRADVERDEEDSKLYFHLSFVLTDWANLG